jgi:hypothetical protein
MTAASNASEGLKLLEKSILDCLKAHPAGLGNSDLARTLGLESDFGGKQKNYLTWSVLGLLANQGLITVEKVGSRVRYKIR